MITCPICKSSQEGLEAMPVPEGGFVLYCPECSWISDSIFPYPIQEIKVVQTTRIIIEEEKDD